MLEFLLTEEAKNEARRLLETLRENNSLSLPPDSENYPLSLLKEGVMLSVLIAQTKGGERKVLYGFSGSVQSRYIIPGFVPPCFSSTDFNSVFEKYDARIHEYTRLIEEEGRTDLVEERKALSHTAQREYEKIFVLSRWDGGRTRGLPPRPRTGTGECAGLKTINTCLRKGWEMKGLAEFRYTLSGDLEFQPPCEERCGTILPDMLGLEFLYADEDIAVVVKPSGMLSVPGRGEEKKDSVSYRFHTLFPSSPEICHVHRLDMDTSGLLVLAFHKEALKNLMLQFEKREVQKTYVALLEGVITETEGEIDLPIRLDVDNRPHQIVDLVQGKEAHTHWERIHVATTEEGVFTRVRFFPHTGRTHQLRVHAASGLHHPIKGDNLYGHQKEGERLALHAESITFRHPRTGEMMTFTSPAPF